MQFNITWDSSVGSAPAAFKSTVLSVAQYFASQFTDSVTVNLAVGFGEVKGSSLPSGALGASLTYFAQTTYSSLKTALTRDALTADDATAVKSLAASDPAGNGHYWTTTADAKALGLTTYNGMDGYIGFSKTAAFDYTQSDGIRSGQYDFYATVAHEISEVMGRQVLAGETLGSQTKSFETLDLFHYASSGVRGFNGTTAGYFSIDGGVTKSKSFNTNSSGDFGDWASTSPDAFNAFSSSGVVNPISAADLQTLDVIGWNRGASAATTTVSSSGSTSIVASAGLHALAMVGSAITRGHITNEGHKLVIASDLDYFLA